MEFLISLTRNPAILISAGLVLLIGSFILIRYILYCREPANYFVRWLTNEQKSALQQASIPFSTTGIDESTQGVLFSKKYFRRALRVLKARVIDTHAKDDQLHEAVLTFALPKDNRQAGRPVQAAIPWHFQTDRRQSG